MSNIGSPPYVFVNGTIAQASQVNTDFSTIYTDYNGGITNYNIAANAAIDLTKLAAFVCEPGMRLTGLTGTPIPITDIASTSNLYVTPYAGGMVPLYNGTAFHPYLLSEITIALSGLTNGVVYDVYIALSGASIIADAPLAWATPTTPPSRQFVNGLWFKGSDLTRLLVGSFVATAANATADTIGSRYISNAINQVPRYMQAVDNTATWAYASTVVRAANGSTAAGVGAVYFIQSVQRYPIVVNNRQIVQNSTINFETAIGLALDSTTVYDTSGLYQVYANNAIGTIAVTYIYSPQIGNHFIARLESTIVGGTGTYYGGLASGGLSAIIYT